MKYVFPYAIIILFALASVVAFIQNDWKLGWIYLLSAGLNVVFIMPE